MSKILIVEDEEAIADLEKDYLELSDFEVTIENTGDKGLETAMTGDFDLVILDLMLPGMDGFELLQEIRAVSTVPVLMLTAKGEAEDRFAGFELGADDYLVKPFLPKELLLRVQAILKRAYPPKDHVVQLEAAAVDLDQAEVIKNSQRIPLTAKEYSIFQKLADNAGHIVTIGLLCQAVCGEIWQGYETTLMTHIRHLREKIEENPSKPVSLLTVKGLGYKLLVKEPEK